MVTEISEVVPALMAVVSETIHRLTDLSLMLSNSVMDCNWLPLFYKPATRNEWTVPSDRILSLSYNGIIRIRQPTKRYIKL